VHQPPAASVSLWSSTSRANSSTPLSRHNCDQQDALGLLSLFPSPASHPDNTFNIDNSPSLDFTYDFNSAAAAIDFTNASPDLLLSGLEDNNNTNDNNNWLADSCLLDPSIDLSGGGVMIPDMATHQTPPLGDMSSHLALLHDEFFTQDTSNLLQGTTLEPPTAASVNNTLTTSSTSTSNSPSYAPNSSAFSTFAVNLPTAQSSSSPSDDGSFSSTTGTKRKASSPPEDEIVAKDLKRQRNTLAARKYRQKRLDRIAELEQALADMTGDRDDLRLKLARREAEVDALREMLGSKK
jgi:hypothetical protein